MSGFRISMPIEAAVKKNAQMRKCKPCADEGRESPAHRIVRKTPMCNRHAAEAWTPPVGYARITTAEEFA